VQCAVVLPAALCCALLKLLQSKLAVFAAMYSFDRGEQHAFCRRFHIDGMMHGSIAQGEVRVQA
jgi:hypothetical protein